MSINHHIKSQVIDIDFDGDQQQAHQLYLTTKDLFYKKLEQILIKCLDEIDEPGFNIKIDNLELDLGEILLKELPEDLPEKLEIQLRKSLKDLGHKGHLFLEKEPIQMSYVEILIFYLKKGFLKWNDQGQLEEAIDYCIAQNETKEILNLIIKNASARKRFIQRVDERNFLKLVSSLEPENSAFIIEYYTKVKFNLLNSNTISKGENRVNKIVFGFILTYLLVSKGSQFNRYEFVRNQLAKLAAHNNFSLEDLVIKMYHALGELVTAEQSNLKTIIFSLSSELGFQLDKNYKYENSKKYNFISSFFNSVLENSEGYTIDSKYSINSITKYLNEHPNDSVEELMKVSNREKLISRIIKVYGIKVIHVFINILEPTGVRHILSYQDKLLRIQKSHQIVQYPVEAFHQTLWKISLINLLESRGSFFNQKSFLISMIQNVASHFNLTYESILHSVWESSKLLAGQINETKQFTKLIDEIYNETLFIEVSNEEKDIHLNEIENKSRDEIVLLKLLKDSSLYEKLSVWQFSHIISEFIDEKHSQKYWQLLFEGLSNVSNKEKFFKAVTEDQFIEIINQIQLERTLIISYKRVADVISKILSQSIDEFQVKLKVSFFSLLMMAQKNSKNNTSIFGDLILNAIKFLPVKPEKILNELTQLNLSLNESREFQRITEFLNLPSYTPSSFSWIDEVIQLIVNDNEDYSSVGFVDIVQFFDFVVESAEDKVQPIFKQLQRKDIIKLSRLLPLSIKREIIAILERKTLFNLSGFIDNVERKLTDEKHSSSTKILENVTNVILVNLYLPAQLKIDKLVKQLFAVIKNTDADIIFDIPSVSLPLEGKIDRSIEQIEERFSDGLQLIQSDEKAEKNALKNLLEKKEILEINMPEEIFINNAGIVIIHPYLPFLFEQAGYLTNNEFTSEETQIQAVLYLHYIYANTTSYQDDQLVIFKILCGVSLTQAIDVEFEISEKLENLIVGLFNAIISHWSKVSNSSHDEFKGAWLCRNGKIITKENFIELTVEQTAYDILMDHLPFTLSPVVLSWMEKPINVHWR